MSWVTNRRTRGCGRLCRLVTVGGTAWAVLVGLAACQSSSTGTGTAAAPPSTAGPAQAATGGGKPGCDLAPRSLVASILGLDLKDGPHTLVNQTVTVCSYTTNELDEVTIRFETGVDANGFTAAKQGFAGSTITDVPGFEDEAFTNIVSLGSHTIDTLIARKGTLDIELVSPASVDREKTLEARLFAATA